MPTSRTPRALSLGTKLTLANVLLTALLFGAFVLASSLSMSRAMERQAVHDLRTQTDVLAEMVKGAATNVLDRTDALAIAFGKTLAGNLELSSETLLIKERQTPVLKLNGKPLNLVFGGVDEFSESTGSVATIFARSGDDFVRISTSVKNEKGERAVGTLLDRSHPSYAALSAGKRYVGPATLFGRQYMTQYDLIHDAAGRSIGIAFIGVDITQLLTEVKTTIRGMKIGSTGHFFVMDSRPGKTQGQLIVHPTQEGANLIEAKDTSDRLFIKAMLDAKNGDLSYEWANRERGETKAREKLAAFRTVEALNWLIAGDGYVDEFAAAARSTRNTFMAVGLVMLLLSAAATFFLIRRQVIRPLARVQRMAEAIAEGDLSVRVQTRRADEVGQLMGAVNQIGTQLTEVVQAVRQNAESVATASSEIEQSNFDLSARTENQAASLQQTSTAMEELGSTVQENASVAGQASTKSLDASRAAEQTREAMSALVDTMKGINASSRRIEEISSMIDTLAFQTNILALNAAVESARAGDAGRGFAVVASEVRNLAARSAEAAKEIKSLIADSVQRVDAGSEQVHVAGQRMGQLVASIGDVTQIVSGISHASQEQATGVREVGTAVAQMDEGTQQNSALVEEMAAAASSLRVQAQTLVETVSKFKL